MSQNWGPDNHRHQFFMDSWAPFWASKKLLFTPCNLKFMVSPPFQMAEFNMAVISQNQIIMNSNPHTQQSFNQLAINKQMGNQDGNHDFPTFAGNRRCSTSCFYPLISYNI